VALTTTTTAAAVFSIGVHSIKIVPRGFPATATAATVFTGCPGSQSNAFDNPSPSFNPITLLSPEKSVPATLLLYTHIHARTRTREGTFQRLFPPSLSHFLYLSLSTHSHSLSLSVCHYTCNIYRSI